MLIDALRQCGADILGITDPDSSLVGKTLMSLSILGADETILAYSPQKVLLVNALGSVKNTNTRARLYETWKAKGYTFAKVIHPSAVIAADVQLSEGVQVLAGAIINPGTTIGENTLINTASVIEHECRIGKHVHVAGARVAGQVQIADYCHVGIGSTLIQNITLAEHCLIAAGAVVVTSCPAGAVMMGVPARDRRA